MGSNPSAVKGIDPTALVHPTARIGKGTKVWAFVQIAEKAVIGRDCVIANGSYIDRHVVVGNRVRIHNKALLYHGLVVEDDVFIGPGVCFTNDPYPRSGKTRDMRGKKWTVGKGASIGANATILPDISIGSYAVVGAGSVVTRAVPDQTVVAGNPAEPIGVACACGVTLKSAALKNIKYVCPTCKKSESRRSAKILTSVHKG